MSISLSEKNTTKVAALDNLADGQTKKCYQSLLRRLSWPSHGHENGLVTVGITSSLSGEGTSTVALRLAAAAAGFGGNRVLLVDYNLTNPAIADYFGLSEKAGMIEVLQKGQKISGCVQSTSVANLSCLTAGVANADAEFVYDSFGLEEMIESLRSDFELVVFDMPPVGKVSDATRLAGLLDGVLLVVEAERVRWEVALRTKELLLRADANLLGVVLNKRRQHVPNWLYRTL